MLADEIKLLIAKTLHGDWPTAEKIAGGEVPLPVVGGRAHSFPFDEFTVVTHHHTKAGVVFEAHEHESNQLGFCFGEALLIVDGVERVIKNEMFTVAAGIKHAVIAIEDNVSVYCVFSKDTK